MITTAVHCNFQTRISIFLTGHDGDCDDNDDLDKIPMTAHTNMYVGICSCHHVDDDYDCDDQEEDLYVMEPVIIERLRRLRQSISFHHRYLVLCINNFCTFGNLMMMNGKYAVNVLVDDKGDDDNRCKIYNTLYIEQFDENGKMPIR